MGVDIGGKIRKIRSSKGISQSALAKRSGVAQSTLSYVENGTKHPHFDTLSAICKGLGVSVFELLSYGEKEIDSKMFEEQFKSDSKKEASGFTKGSKQDFERYLYEKYLLESNK